MAYFGCIGNGQGPTPEAYLFYYTNLTFTSSSDAVVTDVDWDVATLGNKKWRIEFKLHPYTQASYSDEYCFMQGGTARGQEWYIRRNVINCWHSGTGITGAISVSNPADNDEWIIEFEPDPLAGDVNVGTLRLYRNGNLDKTNTNAYISLLTNTPSQSTKIVLGEYQGGQYQFIGTFEYIRMQIIN